MTDTKKNAGGSNTGNSNTGDWNTGYSNTGDWNTGRWNTGDRNAGDRNAGHCNTGNWNAGYCNTGDGNTGSWNTGNRNAGSWNTGDRNTGHWNIGNWNAGYCNTVTPSEVLIFNKIGKRDDWISTDKPSWMIVDLTKWVYASDMTDKEKDAYPSYTTTGGYLKCYSSLKHAYIEAWEKASVDDREKTYKLPNFDPVVFEEIFGFNPCDCVEEKREHTPINDDVIEINGVKYKKI